MFSRFSSAASPLRRDLPGRGTGAGQSQRGVALAVLVWFLAAMSILVAGIVYQAKMDTRMTRLQISRAQATALGDGAIQLALVDLTIAELGGLSADGGAKSNLYTLGGADVRVTVTPSAGLIDLNQASEDLLLALFANTAGLDAHRAAELAANVVEWRAPRGPAAGQTPRRPRSPGKRRFEAAEDLLQVEGVDREIFEGVRGAICALRQGQAGVDWASAPVAVLKALNGGNSRSAIDVVRGRDQEGSGLLAPPTDMDLLFQQSAPTPYYRVDALVSLGTDKHLRRRWLRRGQVGWDGLPWSFYRSEPVRSLNQLEDEEWVVAADGDARK